MRTRWGFAANAARWQKYTPPPPRRPAHDKGVGGRGTRSEEVDLAHVTSIRRFETRAACRAPRKRRPAARKSACSRGNWTGQFRKGRGGCGRYLNFKSANVYFCLESRFHVRSPSPPICPPLSSPPPPFIGRLSPDALNFKFGRGHLPPPCRMSRQQPTFECFHPLMRCHLFPSPIPAAVICVTDTARSTARYLRLPRTFIYGATRYVSELILWFISLADSDAGSAASRHEKANFETAFRSPLRLRTLRAT